MTKQHFQLPDGRNVDYAVSGAEKGFPLIWIHGTPGSYCPDPGFAAVCEKKGVKLITYSRAGYGGSSRHKGRKVVDCVADVKALLAHLGEKKCLVGGWSGGGPHALACAARLDSCVAALCVAGVAPFDAEGLDFLEGQGEDNIQEYHAALKGEAEVREFCNASRPDLLKAEVSAMIDSMATILPAVDQEAMRSDAQLGQFLATTTAEALLVSVDGWVDDDLEFIVPWGFELSEVKVPVFVYQGTEDMMVPFAHGKWIAEHLPKDKLKAYLLEGEGHISLFTSHRDAMIDELLEVAKV